MVYNVGGKNGCMCEFVFFDPEGEREAGWVKWRLVSLSTSHQSIRQCSYEHLIDSWQYPIMLLMILTSITFVGRSDSPDNSRKGLPSSSPSVSEPLSDPSDPDPSYTKQALETTTYNTTKNLLRPSLALIDICPHFNHT